MNLIGLIIGLALGFVLPGYLCSVLLSSPAKWVSSFLISLVILFHGIFWIGLLGFALNFSSVLVYLVLITGILGLCVITAGRRAVITRPVLRTPQNRLMLYPVIACGFLMAVRSFLKPLSGSDTFFRWNFLALQIAGHHTFSFYPPLTPDDFVKYFYVDGIPPMVSFAYWWLYASFGRAVSQITGIVVTAQFALTILVAYRLASRLASARAGCWTMGLLVSSPLFFWAVFMGQETGLTALSFAATMYFLLTARDEGGVRGMMLAGSAAAVGALAREYGVAFIVCGVITAVWLRCGARLVSVFLLTAVGLAAPWYVRNWILAGNPFYSNPVGGLFPVNPVLAGMLSVYSGVYGFSTGAAEKAIAILKILGKFAPLQLLVAMVCPFLLSKRLGFLVTCTGVLVLIWLYSVSHTSGGYFYSTRVLSPAFVMLSVLGGVALDRPALPGSTQKVITGLIMAALCYALVCDLVISEKPVSLSKDDWIRAAFVAERPYETWARDAAPLMRTLNSRILSENAYAHAALHPYGVEIVPIWSPEVRFVFEPEMEPAAIRKRLLALGIRAVLISPKSTNNLYLRKFPFFLQDGVHWLPYLKSDELFVLFVLPPPAEP